MQANRQAPLQPSCIKSITKRVQLNYYPVIYSENSWTFSVKISIHLTLWDLTERRLVRLQCHQSSATNKYFLIKYQLTFMSIFFGISPNWLSTYSNILVYKSFIFSIWRILFLFSVFGGYCFKKALNAVNPAKVEESAFQVFSNYFFRNTFSSSLLLSIFSKLVGKRIRTAKG